MGGSTPTRRRGWALGGTLLVAFAAVGCANSKTFTEQASQTVQKVQKASPFGPAAPATQVLCFWQKQLSELPDPTRDGTPRPGLAGQMFLIASDSSAAEMAGDVTVAVFDETPRPAGVPPKKQEVWHFTKETMKQLVSGDERFGKNYVMFIPWPDDWRDVSAVRIQVRYDSTNGPTIYAGDSRIALDLAAPGGPIWKDAPGASENRSVPSGAKLVEQMKATATPTGQPTIIPAGGVLKK